jgi:plasmid stabilization system protein ParE
LRYSREALRDLDELFVHIATDSGPERAALILTRIERHLETVADFPLIGRVRRDLLGGPRAYAGIWPYVVLYKPFKNGIVALRILDGRRDLPRLFGEA